MPNDVALELHAHAVLLLPRISDEDAKDEDEEGEEEAGDDGDAGTQAGGEAGALHWRWSIMLAGDTFASVMWLLAFLGQYAAIDVGECRDWCSHSEGEE